MVRLFLTALAYSLLCVTGVSHADDIVRPPHPGPCEPGFMWVEEVTYQEVCKKVCKVVPDVKKTSKWVYSCKPEDFCLPKCPHILSGHGRCGSCQACLQCDHPMSRNLLVKRLVVEECPSSKCVIETIVERVPCVTWKKVPCSEPIGPGKKIMPPAGAIHHVPSAPAPITTIPAPAARPSVPAAIAPLTPLGLPSRSTGPVIIPHP